MTGSKPEERDVQSSSFQFTPATSNLDELFAALANQRRRIVVQCLCEYQAPMALADLAAEVTSQEQEMPIPEIPDEEVKQVSISLHHSHVPKLVDSGLVEHTQEHDLVTLSIESDHAESFIDNLVTNL